MRDQPRSAGVGDPNRGETRLGALAIIGAGPIGLELAVGLKHAGVEFAHFEAGAIGSTIGWWAPETRFFSSPERIEIAGVPLTSVDQSKASREEYLVYLRGVARQFDLSIHTYTRVVAIARHDGAFEIETVPSAHGVGGPAEARNGAGKGVEVSRCQGFKDSTPRHLGTSTPFARVILAIGDMHRPRMIDVPGEDLPHVSHYLGEIHNYFGSRVLIVGGKNSAVEAALRLYRCGAKVIMSYRGDGFDPQRVKYWLRPELEWLIAKGEIKFHSRTLVTRIERERVMLADAASCAPAAEIEADFVLLLTGYEQDTQLFEQLGMELIGEERAPKLEPATMQTSVPGVFVAGTAAAGSQKRAKVFIENSHVHVRRIVRAVGGIDLLWISDNEYSALAES